MPLAASWRSVSSMAASTGTMTAGARLQLTFESIAVDIDEGGGKDAALAGNDGRPVARDIDAGDAPGLDPHRGGLHAVGEDHPGAFDELGGHAGDLMGRKGRVRGMGRGPEAARGSGAGMSYRRRMTIRRPQGHRFATGLSGWSSG